MTNVFVKCNAVPKFTKILSYEYLEPYSMEGAPSTMNIDSQNMETGSSIVTKSSSPPVNLERIRLELNLLISSVKNQQKFWIIKREN